MARGKGKAEPRRGARSALGQIDQIAGTSFGVRPLFDIAIVGSEAHRRRLEIYARARARNKQIQLSFGAAGSFTDMKGNVTVDATVPADGSAGERYIAIEGLLSHELWHERITPRQLSHEFFTQMRSRIETAQRTIGETARQHNRLLADAERGEQQRQAQLAALRAQLAALPPGDPARAGLEQQIAALEAQGTKDAKALERKLGKLQQEFLAAAREQMLASTEKDFWNIIEDGRIEEHCREQEPLEYQKISLMNRVFPRVQDSWTVEAPDGHDPTEPVHLLPKPDGYTPVDAAGNELPLLTGPDGREMVALMAGTEIPTWSERPLDPRRQARAALLAEAVPEFSALDKPLHPDVRACLEECSPFVEEGVCGNGQGALDAAGKCLEVFDRRGMLPEPQLPQPQQGGGEGQQGEGQGGGGQGGGQSSGGGQQSGEQQSGGGQQSGQQSADSPQSGGQSGGESGEQQGGGQSGGGQSGGEPGKEQQGQGGGGQSAPLPEQLEQPKLGDGGGSGDGVSDALGSAPEGEDGGGLSKDKRKQNAAEGKGSADEGKKDEALKRGEQDSQADRKAQQAEEQGRRRRGDLQGSDWSAPAGQEITAVEQIRMDGDRETTTGPLASYGNQLAAQLRELETLAIAPQRHLRSGRLERKRLPAAVSGNERVFRRNGEGINTDLACEVVLDLSGSMDGHRQALHDAAVTSHLAMKRLRVPHGIWGYDSAGYSTARHYEFKSVGSEDARGLAKIGQGGPGHGGTPTPDAVEFATARLGSRRENTRVMLVFTDGAPNGGSNGLQATAKRVQEARRQGMVVVGCLFQEGNYAHHGQEIDRAMGEIFGEDFVKLKDVGELPRELGKRLKKLITRNARR